MNSLHKFHAYMLPIRRDVALKPFTTFKIGGKAAFFVEVTTVGELTEALDYAKDNKLPSFVFAGGSNLLVADRGFPGLVIRVNNRAMRLSGNQIFADAGVELIEVVKLACEQSLAGLERLAGIPGSFGGAIRGNAGAFGMEIKDAILTVKAYDRKSEQVREFTRAQCDFSYRRSYFKDHPEMVILSAVLALTEGNPEELRRVFEETVKKREQKHPQNAQCAGSFFMNPTVDDPKLIAEFERDNGVKAREGRLPAGWLIDHVGLRGKRIGGAMVSTKHPNYFVNTGTATAEHVIMLSSLVKQRVRDELGVQLKEEVQFVGL